MFVEKYTKPCGEGILSVEKYQLNVSFCSDVRPPIITRRPAKCQGGDFQTGTDLKF